MMTFIVGSGITKKDVLDKAQSDIERLSLFRKVVRVNDTELWLIGSKINPFVAWDSDQYAIKSVDQNGVVMATVEFEKWVPPWFWFGFVLGLVFFLAGWIFPVVHLIIRYNAVKEHLNKVGNMIGRGAS